MRRPHAPARRPCFLSAAAGFGLLAAIAGARAEETMPYRPVVAEVGAAVRPPADLLAVAKRLNAAAAAKDGPAVFALLADRVSVITSGITPASGRDVETEGPWRDADAALEKIGGQFLEGDVPAGGAAVSSAGSARLFEMIVEATSHPEWGRDPLAKAGICTYRGLRWNAEAWAKIDDGSRGFHVLAPTPVTAAPQAKAAVLGTLKPGQLYLQGELADLPDGWRGVRLPSGEVGAVRDSAVRDPAVWGLCFVRKAGGGWQVGVFASALL